MARFVFIFPLNKTFYLWLKKKTLENEDAETNWDLMLSKLVEYPRRSSKSSLSWILDLHNLVQFSIFKGYCLSW